MRWQTVSRRAANGGEYSEQEDALLTGAIALAHVSNDCRKGVDDDWNC